MTVLPFKRLNLPIEENKSFSFAVLSDKPMGSCQGDSGSPVIMKSPDGKSCVIAVLAGGDRDKKIEMHGHTTYGIYKAPTPIKYPQLLTLIKEERLPTAAEQKEWKQQYGLDFRVFHPPKQHQTQKQANALFTDLDDDNELWKCYMKSKPKLLFSGRAT